jgi:lipopolysaccharide transport system permease protein
MNLLPNKEDLMCLVRVYRDHRPTLAGFTRRYVHSAFRSSALGWSWLLLQPMVMLVAYTLVFAFIFVGKYNGAPNESNWDYSIAVYTSLTVFGFATDIIGGAPVLFEMQRSLLTNTRIPPEVFVVAFVQSAIIRFSVALVPCLAIAAIFSSVHMTGLWVIPLYAGYAVFLLGLAFLLAVVGIRLPDSRQLISLISTILMFSSAVFYSVSRVPPWLQAINPILQAVDLTREFLLWGRPVADFLPGLAYVWAAAAVSLSLGLAVLRMNRGRLTD